MTAREFFRAFRQRLALSVELSTPDRGVVFLPTADPDGGEWRIGYRRAMEIKAYLTRREWRASK